LNLAGDRFDLPGEAGARLMHDSARMVITSSNYDVDVSVEKIESLIVGGDHQLGGTRIFGPHPPARSRA